MKKILMIVVAALFLGCIGIAYHTASSVAAESAINPICPSCDIKTSVGEKPILSKLAGKNHKCQFCSKEYTVAADQTANMCKVCGGEVIACPACGLASLVRT